MSRVRRRSALALLSLAGLLSTAVFGDEAGWSARRSVAGLALDVELEGLSGGEGVPRAGEVARLRLGLRDGSGTALDGAEPAAWMRRRGGAAPEVCGEEVARYLTGDLFSRADIDFNVYYILTLDHDATLRVVDPLFGFGGSRLLALVPLASPGADWVLVEGPGTGRLFVSQPEAGQVAVIRTDTWELERQLDVGPGVGRLRLQGDEAFVWALHPEGLVAIDTLRGERAGEIALERPGRDFVLDPRGGLHAFVLETGGDEAEAGGVEVLDLVRRQSLGWVDTGPGPTSIDGSELSGAVWVGHRSGRLSAVDLEPSGPRRRLEIETDLPIDSVRFAPGGRLGFVLSTHANTLAVVDTARGRVVQRGPMAGAPDQVAFSRELAYIRDRKSEQVLMVPLPVAGNEGAPIQAADFPGGSLPPAPAPGDPPVLAPSFAQAPGASAMVVANARDGAIYFYMEGMAAPMGHFVHPGRRPLAVKVVDRSLRPADSGVYETYARLEEPGIYDLAVFLDAPRLVECFTLEVAPSPAVAESSERALRLVREAVRALPGGGVELVLERPYEEAGSSETSPPPDELVLLVSRVAGGWHRRVEATRVRSAEPGEARFRARVVPTSPGDYLVWSETESRGAPLVRLRIPARDEAKPAGP